jgi:hypothetical protein
MLSRTPVLARGDAWETELHVVLEALLLEQGQ